ncbi:MAG: hypothetical protein J5J06_20350 [Phycisphaerae bacterium]|nr:hypothetical protein [Phycisphaerae bacterium]
MSARSRILFSIWAAMIGAVVWVLLPLSAAPAVAGRWQGPWSYAFPLVLVMALWFAARAYYGWAALFMLAGGLLNLPFGVIAILGASAARREWARSREKPDDSMRCLKCGYDLRGAPVPRCPECGCLYGFTKTAEELGLSPEELKANRRWPNRGRED